MFSSWWDFWEECASYTKSARSCCLVLKLLKFSLYLVLNEKIQYSHKDDLKKIIFNTMFSKLRGVCLTQSCDPPHSLGTIWGLISNLRGACRIQSCDPPRNVEIIWVLKMSKLLNLIAYSIECLLTCTNWVLNCLCECLAKHTCWIIVAHLEMISILFIYACLAWDQCPYACGDFV
jgi:hypothetical protein